MLKRIPILVIFLLLSYTNVFVFAGDIPEGIMEGNQKALFIGEIKFINTDTFSIIPSTIMMGNIEQSEIEIEQFDSYYGTNDKPKTGDFVVAVLLDDQTIDDMWIFKTTSDDYRTLKLISEQYPMVVRYEQYINEGKYFEAQEKLEKENKTYINSTSVNETESVEIVENVQIPSKLNNNLVIPLLILFFVFVFVFLAKSRKNK
ncbi:MAG: hypothetical protein ACK4M9_03520 [Anaerobacillus sp.]|uniref:hypothetical protein n=1 Tax=Anaerobacillus sp. TaxID=1872506 RepID=UPI00391AAF78